MIGDKEIILRVVQINSQAENGGAQIFSTWLSQKIIDAGYQCEIIYLYKKFDSPLVRENEILVATRPNKITDIFKMITKLRSNLKAHDILICHNPWSLFFVLISIFFEIRSYKILFVQHSRTQFYSFSVRLCLKIMLRIVPEIKKIAIFRDPSMTKFTFIPNPILRPLTKQVISEKSEPDNVFKIGIVARHSEEKNIHFVIRNLAKCPNIHITFIGQGPLSEILHEYATKHLTKNSYEFILSLPHNEVIARLQTFDCLISASTSEGLPLTCLEAASVDLPMFLSNIPGHDLFFEHKIACLFSIYDESRFEKDFAEFRIKVAKGYFLGKFELIKSALSERSVADSWLHTIIND